MNASPWTSSLKRFALFSGLALSPLLSCEPSNKVKAGPPQLLSFGPVGANGADEPLVDPDGGAALPVSARSSIVAVFDRLLDPTYLEDLTDTGPAGKTGVATIQTSIGHSDANIVYVPNGDTNALLLPPGPRILITPSPTLPSGATVTVTLSKDKVVSKAGEAFVVGTDDMGIPRTKETLTFTTEPLSVGFAPAPNADGGAVCGSLEATGAKGAIILTFNNAVDQTAIGAHVSVTAKDASGVAIAGVDATASKTVSTTDSGMVTVQPVVDADGGATGWPAGATLTVTVDAQAQDAALGTALGTPTSACFVVGGSS